MRVCDRGTSEVRLLNYLAHIVVHSWSLVNGILMRETELSEPSVVDSWAEGVSDVIAEDEEPTSRDLAEQV